MFASRYVLARTTTAVASTSLRLLAPSSSAPRKSRRKRQGSAAAKGTSDGHGADGRESNVSAAVSIDAAAAEVDEVERLLAATTTRAGSATPVVTSSQRHPTRALASADKGDDEKAIAAAAHGTGPSPAAALDASSVLHFKAVHETTAAATSTTTRAGPTHAQQEQIERRRSKPSVAEAEVDVGVTERLVPELPRLPALHEVHYGDAVVCEVDRSSYFAERGDGVTAAAAQTNTKASSETTPSAVVIGGESYVELSLDGDLSDADFNAFDAETATTAAKSDTAPQTGEATSDRSAALPSSEDAVIDPDDVDEDVVASPLAFGTARPWFVPPFGVVALEPLPPADCALLLRFALYLRQQTPADLVPTLRRALQQTEESPKDNNNNSSSSSGNTNTRHKLTLADVIRYLDTAPPPVIGFTESLPSPNAASTNPSQAAASSSPSSSSSSLSFADTATASPAFVFHLYLENVSSQNAIGHLATFFGIPQRCFQTHSAVSKMSCTTVLCAVAENRVRREHLLLLNTLRHPGFVLRVSNLQEVSPDRYARRDGEEGAGTSPTDPVDPATTTAATTTPLSVSQQLFGELARWQPLYQTELLLRRVTGDASSGGGTRQQLEHRLRAVQTLGAVCFCANREASLARAATDVLHGFFKSALLNALQRRKAPAPMQRFLRRPNVATAQHAHHVSTDPTVRHVLKTFVQTNGDWHATVSRAPYAWRRRWINALRGQVWNTMASQRLRRGGREVCRGDVVLKPAFRDDVHRRGIITVKAEHVMVVTTPAEAAAASLDDVVLPFLRGRYPEHLFAPESTKHPIMTRTSMLRLLRAMHAPQLLLGLTDELRLLLDVRAESAPLLFRRLIVRPLAMEFAILEDKPPMRALHYDAARLLANDRWAAAAQPKKTVSSADSAAPSAKTTAALGRQDGKETPSATSVMAVSSSRTGPCHLLPPGEVLERTTLGARLTSGVLAEDVFSVPSPEDYVVLGHAYRHLSGELVPAAPHSNTADVGDRVYTVYVRAVVEYNLSGLSNMLREYFLLSGIETESDSALQHKVHRLRRELDPETPLLTAPVYCTTCYNRDHDTQEQCAEYQYKVHRRATLSDVAAAVTATARDGDPPLLASPAAEGEARETTHLVGDGKEVDLALNNNTTTASTAAAAAAAANCTVRMRWHLRRRNDEQRWGVHLTKALHLVGMENVRLIRAGAIWTVQETTDREKKRSNATNAAAATALPDAAQGSPWPASWISKAAAPVPTAEDNESPAQCLMRFLRAVYPQNTTSSSSTTVNATESLSDLLLQSPVLLLPMDPAVLQLQPNANSTTGKAGKGGAAELTACAWTLTLVDATPVATQRDVAAALLLSQSSKSRDVWLTFEMQVRVSPDWIEAPAAAASSSSTENTESVAALALARALQHSTHAADAIPQSTAALPPSRRHTVEAAMQAAVHRTSAATQRWLQDLPYRLTLVLVKHRRQLRKRTSWGLQLDGTDMTLVNFARLMVQYMYASTSHEKRLLAAHAFVATLAPAASFPRNDRALTARLFEEVLPGLEPLLNDMYRVVRINNVAVHHKAEAARVMAAFHVSIDEKLTRDTTTPAEDEASDASVPFYLTLTLERKGSSYRLCAAPEAAVAASNAVAASTTEPHTPQPQSHKNDRQSQVTPPAHVSPSSPSSAVPAASSGGAQADAELLDGLATLQCPVRALTPTQLARSSVTLAINRLLLTEQTRNKWGLRLQPGTRRLKAVQQNRFFSFHVFAVKQSQGTRIADTLRLVTTNRPTPQPTATTPEAVDAAVAPSTPTAHVITRSFYLYCVERVNQQVVRHHGALRQALWAAAQPPQAAASVPASSLSGAAEPSADVATAAAAAVSALPPESVTLTVRQFPLLRFAATVRRGGVGESSALGPVGLQVDRNMRVLSVLAGSPMARALTEAVGPLCAARRLVTHPNDDDDAVDNDRTSPADAWAVVALPHLRALMAKVEAAHSRKTAQTSLSKQKKTPLKRQWAYELDEDATTATDASLPPSASNTQGDSETSSDEEQAALHDLADAAAHTYQQLARCSMVDGVHVLQTTLLYEYAMTRLTAATNENSSDDVRAQLVELRDQLEAVYAQVRWEVVYAAQSNRPLRTPADLAAVFAPGVAEETISVQQFVED